MSTVIIYTMAYNAEKTLRRTVDSVLGQTYADFKYYLCDHGSTDSTREIVLEYAARDKRITPVLLGENYYTSGGAGGNPFHNFIGTTLIDEFEKGNAEYFCMLDADDEFKPGFLEKTLAFMEDKGLDIAACESDIIRTSDNQLTNMGGLEQDLVFTDGDAFGEYFTKYFRFMRAVWGKIFKISTIKQSDFAGFDAFQKIKYGADTLFCMRALSYAERAGVLAEPLHICYQYAQSASRKWDGSRAGDDRILLDEIIDFLENKAGAIDPVNMAFIFGIYCHAIRDTLALLLSSDKSNGEKFEEVYDIICCEQTRVMTEFAYTGTGYAQLMTDLDELFELVQQWIIARFFDDKGERTAGNLERAADIFAATARIHVIPSEWGTGEILDFCGKMKARASDEVFKQQVEILRKHYKTSIHDR